jgi:hypothetical protein
VSKTGKTDPRRNVQLGEEIVRLDAEGKSVRQIAKAVGRSATRVHALLHEDDADTKETHDR